MKTRPISFRLGCDLIEHLDRIADSYGKNRNTLVAEVLETFVRTNADIDVEGFTKGVRRS